MMLVGLYNIRIMHVQGRQFKYDIMLSDGTVLASGTNDNISELGDQIMESLKPLIRIDLQGFTQEKLYGKRSESRAHIGDSIVRPATPRVIVR